MNILTNWIFWIIIAAIVFILALIGYLSESKKKNKKSLEESDSSLDSVTTDLNKESISAVNNEVQTSVNSHLSDSDFNVMPEVSSMVSQPSDATANSTSVLETPVSSVEPVVETSNSEVVDSVALEPVSDVVDVNSAVEVPTTTETLPVSDSQDTIEPASVFTANADNVVSSAPTPVPAEPTPASAPTPIPAANTSVKAENLSTSSNDNIETL